jgi:hypothetical protein
MNTKQKHTDCARDFRGWAKGELARQRLSVTALARVLGKSRMAVSRAINRGEFPGVQLKIKAHLSR